jgi:hypothetical protein
MRFLVISLLVSWTITLGAPQRAVAELFTSPFAKHGVVDPRLAPYLPPLEKKVEPRYWRRGLIFPCTVPCRHNEHNRKKPKTSKRTLYRDPVTLDPNIFNPAPKTPLTLVIEDGVVVDSYQGY